MERERTEHEEQREFVQWFRQSHRDQIIFAIPNGGFRGKAQAGKLKAEGVMPGVWDLFCPDMRLWIEFKRVKTGTLSDEQKKFGAHVLRLGYRCMVAYGCQDAINQLPNGERESWERPKK